MRSVSVVLILVVVAIASTSSTGKVYYDVNNAPALFEEFIKEYNRNYKDAADKDAHYQAFVTSLGKINKLNEQSTSATFGINDFADFTEEERIRMFGPRRQEN